MAEQAFHCNFTLNVLLMDALLGQDAGANMAVIICKQQHH